MWSWIPAVTAPLFAAPSVVVAAASEGGAEADLMATVPGPAAATAAVDRDAVAKILFTSGSTGDAHGFYRTGDAVSLADRDDLNAGLVFRGRIAEDFKLDAGTFVRVGAVRTALLSAAPLLADAVIAGEERGSVCALAWLNAAEARKLLG